MWAEDLQPFLRLASQLLMIMVAHVYCPCLESALAPAREKAPGRLPATLSPRIVSDLLKGRIGFQGLVLSDDLEMGGALEDRSIEQAAISALKAGCDMLLLCGAAANTRKAFDALLREANSDAGFHTIVERAAEKVLLAKQRLGFTGRQAGQALPDFEALRQDIRRFSAAVDERLSSGAAQKPPGED